MKYTKGNWDLSSKEFKSRNLLGKMTLLDAKMSDIGLTIEQLKNQYILDECEFKQGEKIYYKHYTNNFKCGILDLIFFSLDDFAFYYSIKPLNKGFTETNQFRSNVFIHPSRDSQYERIKKAKPCKCENTTFDSDAGCFICDDCNQRVG